MIEETKVVKNEEETATVPPAVAPATDAEVLIAQLEADKAKLIVESANYKMGMLKAKGKVSEGDEETEDERIERIVSEKIANQKIAAIDSQKEVLLNQILKENKELKLAQLNKTTVPPASIGAHTESTPVTDTVVTPEQLAAFKAKGWTDKDIERYKRNLQKYSGR